MFGLASEFDKISLFNFGFDKISLWNFKRNHCTADYIVKLTVTSQHTLIRMDQHRSHLLIG